MTKGSGKLSFSAALERLEKIIARLEEPNLDLEEGLKLLEEGVELHKHCKSKLTQASAKISTILEEDNSDSIDSKDLN